MSVSRFLKKNFFFKNYYTNATVIRCNFISITFIQCVIIFNYAGDQIQEKKFFFRSRQLKFTEKLNYTHVIIQNAQVFGGNILCNHLSVLLEVLIFYEGKKFFFC
jgi:hypothetical protein